MAKKSPYYFEVSKKCLNRSKSLAYDIAEMVTQEYVMTDFFGHNGDTKIEIIKNKVSYIALVSDFCKKRGVPFDEFNGLAPTRENYYKAYDFSALWIWSGIISILENDATAMFSDKLESGEFYSVYTDLIASTMKRYPNLTLFFLGDLDLKMPENKFYECSKIDDANFEDDKSDEYVDDAKANAFRDWIISWSSGASEKDKMRVRNWFDTCKSHKQILAEINKVVGNSLKFNARLALFVERLFDHKNLDNFFSKSGFSTKEEMLMTYFDRLKDFDEQTKKDFIKKFM